MNFRAVPRGHTLYYGIVTGTRALAAERDGFTERPWQGGARGACGIRRFNHPRRERDGGAGGARERARGTMPCYWPARRPRPPGLDTGADAPSENRPSARADAAKLLSCTIKVTQLMYSRCTSSTWWSTNSDRTAPCRTPGTRRLSTDSDDPPNNTSGIPSKIYKAG